MTERREQQQEEKKLLFDPNDVSIGGKDGWPGNKRLVVPRKSILRRVWKVFLWWCTFLGAINMAGCLFYLLDMLLKRG